MGKARNLQDILADIRGECVSGMASIQLVRHGTYTEPQAFIKIVRSLNKIIEFVGEGEKLLVLNRDNFETWNE